MSENNLTFFCEACARGVPHGKPEPEPEEKEAEEDGRVQDR